MQNKRKIPLDMTPGTIHKTNGNGEFKILDYVNANEVLIEFISTGYTTKTRTVRIRDGAIKDYLMPTVCGVGFIGVGDFSSKHNGEDSQIYKTWLRMITRCYNDKSLEKHPAYKDCSVCDDWHNFQNFAEWMSTKNYKGKQLDKDIKVTGNRVYSPETCLFVSHYENVFAANAKSYKFLSPDGEFFYVDNLKEFCIKNNLTRSLMTRVNSGERPSHKGWTKA